jgi:hypothetical protein
MPAADSCKTLLTLPRPLSPPPPQELEANYAALAARLDQERNVSKQLKNQLAASLTEQNESLTRIEQLQQELADTHTASVAYQEEAVQLKAKLEATAGLLAGARVNNGELAADGDKLRGQVHELKMLLEGQSMELQAERAASASTRQQLEQLKQEYKSAGGRLEEPVCAWTVGHVPAFSSGSEQHCAPASTCQHCAPAAMPTSPVLP